MPFWKPLLAIAPAGLVLGMIGGHLARPEMTQRISGEPWQPMFQSRNGQPAAYPAQPQGELAYVGGYSYPPYLATTNADWSPPAEDKWSPADAPLPTLAQLDARQAALLADPDVEFAVRPPSEEVEGAADAAQATAGDAVRQPEQAQALASAEPPEVGPEPHKADGEPAIW
jgi:hypothetical protein